MKDLDQYIKSKKSILDTLPNNVDIFNKILVFSPLGDFVLNR